MSDIWAQLKFKHPRVSFAHALATSLLFDLYYQALRFKIFRASPSFWFYQKIDTRINSWIWSGLFMNRWHYYFYLWKSLIVYQPNWNSMAHYFSMIFHDFPWRGGYFYEHHYDEPTYLNMRAEGDNTIFMAGIDSVYVKRIDWHHSEIANGKGTGHHDAQCFTLSNRDTEFFCMRVRMKGVFI